MDQSGDHMKMNFQIQKVRAEKVDEKKWGHLSNLHVPFLSYGP